MQYAVQWKYNAVKWNFKLNAAQKKHLHLNFFLDLFLKYILCFLKKTVERLDHNVFKAVGIAALCSGFN